MQDAQPEARYLICECELRHESTRTLYEATFVPVHVHFGGYNTSIALLVHVIE